ncbi:MAG: hypothetical protein AUH92_03200 [Acidobacteria bacterium 13_1_40CM_4_69_4]|nr:MAG: hypothetical protein AUH92_03200 [Acidobacteria bacterium 13_1_40CM_4_69_4]
MKSAEALSLGRARARLARSAPSPDSSLPILENFRTTAAAAGWFRRKALDRSAFHPEFLEEVEILRYRPARRCTLRLRFGGPADRCVYVKVCRPGRAERIARDLESLRALGPWPDLRVPPVLALVPEEGIVILGELAGAGLDERLAEVADPGREVVEAARAIARLHSLPLSCARTWTAADEMAVLRTRRPFLHGRVDLAREGVEEVYRRIAVGAALLDALPRAPLHRDLHPQQILLDGSSGGLVDFDEMAGGPAEIDLGNLLAHLDLYAVYLPAGAARIEEAARGLVAAYERRRALHLPALMIARAASLIRLACLYAAAPGLADLTPPLVTRAERLLAPAELS